MFFMSVAQFQVIYDGPALRDSSYNARELSVSLAALDRLFESASEALNPPKTRQTLSVKGSFESGSFKINLTTNVSAMDGIKDWLLSENAQAIIAANDLVGTVIGTGVTLGLIGLVKYLKGGQPTKIHENEDGRFKIYRHKSFVNVEKEVWDLYTDYKTRQALEVAICTPLIEDKVDTMAFNRDGEKEFVVVDASEKEYFIAPDLEREDVNVMEHVTYLSLIKVSFREGNKWSVFDGANTINVRVEDEKFLQGIEDNRVLFGKGDRLKVNMRVEQFDIDGSLRTEYFITEVLEHTRPEFKGQADLDLN